MWLLELVIVRFFSGRDIPKRSHGYLGCFFLLNPHLEIYCQPKLNKISLLLSTPTGFELRVILLLEWFPSKARDPRFLCYFTHRWQMKILIHAFLKIISIEERNELVQNTKSACRLFTEPYTATRPAPHCRCLLRSTWFANRKGVIFQYGKTKAQIPPSATPHKIVSEFLWHPDPGYDD